MQALTGLSGLTGEVSGPGGSSPTGNSLDFGDLHNSMYIPALTTFL
jgi:hypothetical protein